MFDDEFYDRLDDEYILDFDACQKKYERAYYYGNC